jgi:hypothetical protein
MPIPKNNIPISTVVLYPVLKVDALLTDDPKRRRFLSKLHLHTGLEETLYQTLYETAITNFVELVQALPYQEGGKPGGLLDYSLERAVIALRHYHQATGADFSPLFAYALFTAALFQEAGKLISQQVVVVSDSEGKFISEWSPLAGSLGAIKAEYYKLRAMDDQWIKLGQAITPLLARQYLPAPGFEWIASDNKIFSLWMDVLTGEKEKGGELDLSYWLQLSYKWLLTLPMKDRLSGQEIELTRPLQTALGEDFFAWLAKGLADGTIAINSANAAVHVLQGGELLLEKEVFEKFCKLHGRGNWLAVSKQASTLGLSKMQGGQYSHEFEKILFKPPEVLDVEGLARSPRAGAFFNAATAGNIAAAANSIREGLVITRPEWLNIKQALPISANLASTAASSGQQSSARYDFSTVQSKADNWRSTSQGSKPFFR